MHLSTWHMHLLPLQTFTCVLLSSNAAVVSLLNPMEIKGSVVSRSYACIVPNDVLLGSP